MTTPIPKHDHDTRVIKPRGKCPACDLIHDAGARVLGLMDASRQPYPTPCPDCQCTYLNAERVTMTAPVAEGGTRVVWSGCADCWERRTRPAEPDAGDVRCGDDDCPRSGQPCPYPGAGCPANEPDAGDVEALARGAWCICLSFGPVLPGDTHDQRCSDLWRRLAARDAEVRRAAGEQIAQAIEQRSPEYVDGMDFTVARADGMENAARIAREVSRSAEPAPPHPQFTAFLDRALQDPEVRAAYEAAQARDNDT